MKRQIWIVGVALAAALMPQLAESVSWTASGIVMDALGSAPVTVGEQVTVTWGYDPGMATPTGDSSCEGVSYYDLVPGAGNIHIEIGSKAWDRALLFLQVENDANCTGSSCFQVGDAIWFSSTGELADTVAYIKVVDCIQPFQLLSSTSAPATETDLLYNAATGVMGILGGYEWSCSFSLDPVPVSASTWTDVKSIYR